MVSIFFAKLAHSHFCALILIFGRLYSSNVTKSNIEVELVLIPIVGIRKCFYEFRELLFDYENLKIMNNLILKTERLNLRPISTTDLEKIHELHSLPETDKFNTLGIPNSIEETRSIVEKWILDNNLDKNKNYTFAVELNNDRQFIGLIGINLGKEKYRNAEVWFKYHHDFWNKGYGTESLRKIINFGFHDLELHRIEAGCAIANSGSISVLEKAGMLRESHTRKLLPLKSGWSDNYGYAILSTD